MCVRTSTAFYGNFILGMGRSPGFGPAHADSYALFTLGFPAAPRPWRLTLPACAARRTVLQKVRGRAHAALPQFVDTGFQVLFHSPHGVLFTFPSQYSALSVTGWYLALRGGPRSFPQGSSCPVVLWIPPRRRRPSPTGLSPSTAGLPRHVPLGAAHMLCGPNPGAHAHRFGLLPFRSPLLRESLLFSPPPAT